MTTFGRTMKRRAAGICEANGRFHHLDAFFAGRRLVSVTGPVIARYVSHRQSEKAANGTICRELGVLLKMLRFAYENGKLLRLPIVHKPKEAPPRQGFFERDAVYRRICRWPRASRIPSAGALRAKC